MSGSSDVRVQKTLNVPVDRAFEAWVNPKQVAQWMLGPRPQDRLVRVQVDARLGGKFSFVVNREGEDVDHTGEYLVFERPRQLDFTWLLPKFTSSVTIIRIAFAPGAPGQTTVTLVQEAVPAEFVDRVRMGWTKILGAVEHASA